MVATKPVECPMRVLMLSDFYWPFVGGVEQHVRGLSTELVRRGHEVMVATLKANDIPEIAQDEGVELRRLSSMTQTFSSLYTYSHRPWAPPFADPAVSRQLKNLSQTFQPEIVHGHDWFARSWFPLKKKHNAPFIMSLHYFTRSCAKKVMVRQNEACSGPSPAKCFTCSWDNYGFKGPPIAFANWMMRQKGERMVDKFISVSEHTADGNGLSSDHPKSTVIPNFVREVPELSTEAQQYLDQLPKEPYIMFVGDFTPPKGIHILLEAYRNLELNTPLVLIGKEWNSSPQDWPQNVHRFHEWPNEAVLEAWKRSLFAVVPSMQPEAFGIVVIEAMLAGRPVIGSAHGGITEIIQHDKSGLLVKPQSASALQSAMQELLNDSEKLERLAKGAKDRAEDFQVKPVVDRIEAVYTELLDQ